MKLHPRTKVVSAASSELGLFLIDLVKKHELTWTEECSILTTRISECIKYMIREERHPDDPDKRGDEA